MMTPQQQADCTDAGRGPFAFEGLNLHQGTITGRFSSTKPNVAELDEERGKGDSQDEIEHARRKVNPADGSGIEKEDQDVDSDGVEDEDDDDLEEFIEDDEDEDDNN